MSKRQQVLEAVQTRQEAIRKADGFQTDAGETVYLGERPELGPDDPDAVIAIVVRDDQVKVQSGKVFVTLPIAICANAKADLEAPWVAIEALISDIKTAMELEDKTLDGLLSEPIGRGSTRTLDREAGSMTVGASVTYVLSYTEQWGRP
jgi:hypothetical protein